MSPLACFGSFALFDEVGLGLQAVGLEVLVGAEFGDVVTGELLGDLVTGEELGDTVTGEELGDRVVDGFCGVVGFDVVGCVFMLGLCDFEGLWEGLFDLVGLWDLVGLFVLAIKTTGTLTTGLLVGAIFLDGLGELVGPEGRCDKVGFAVAVGGVGGVGEVGSLFGANVGVVGVVGELGDLVGVVGTFFLPT